MRSRVNRKFDTGDDVVRPQASSITLMQIIKRIRVILIWFAGLAFIFAAANKNDPYLISMRGPGNIVLAAVSIAALIVLIRRGYWHSEGSQENC